MVPPPTPEDVVEGFPRFSDVSWRKLVPRQCHLGAGQEAHTGVALWKTRVLFIFETLSSRAMAFGPHATLGKLLRFAVLAQPF